MIRVLEPFTDPINIYWASSMYKALTGYWVRSDPQTSMVSVRVEVTFWSHH